MRTMERICLILTSLVASGCATTPTQQVTGAAGQSLDGAGLRRMCNESPQRCEYVIMEAFNAILTRQNASNTAHRLCPREGLLPEYVVAVVGRYLDARPEVGHWEASRVVEYATVAAFPCYDMPAR